MGEAPTFTVLFVCTGNICRSPLAERLSRAHLGEVLGGQAEIVRVHSAGVRAVVGNGMHPASALVLSGLGGEPAGFTARQFTADMADHADLVLTMSRRHRDVVLGAAPRALARTFTLREAAGLAVLADTGPGVPGDGLPGRAREMVARWAAARSRRTGSAADDVPDPIGQPVEVHQEIGELIAEALLPLLDRLLADEVTAGSEDHA